MTDDAGATLFTRENVEPGQEVFLKYGLMEHGTLWGHGAYLGPRRAARSSAAGCGSRPWERPHPAARRAA